MFLESQNLGFGGRTIILREFEFILGFIRPYSIIIKREREGVAREGRENYSRNN